jgi:hypothetical protein
VKIKETIKASEKLSPDAKKFSGVANLVVDKTIKYMFLMKVMHTYATAGLKEFKLVVMTKTGN